MSLLRWIGRLLLAACVTGACGAQAADGYRVQRLGARTLAFTGVISAASASALLAELDKGASVLVLRSEGGDAHAGMVLGTAIHRAGLVVVVDGYCASSCANYLFLSAWRKVLPAGSLLGFHGSLTGRRGDVELQRIRAGHVRENELIGFGETTRQELAWLQAIGLSRGLFQHVSRDMQLALQGLQRSTAPRSSGEFIIEANGVIEKFGFADSVKLDQAVARYRAAGVPFSASGQFKLVVGGDLSDVFYFPSAQTLRRYGVPGLLHYRYPASRPELEQLAARWFDDVHVRGDFPALEGGEAR